MQFEQAKSELKTTLAGNLGEAIPLLLQRLHSSSELTLDLFAHSGRYHQAASDFNNGIILIGERDTVFNKVRFALLDLVEKIREADRLPRAARTGRAFPESLRA